MRSFRPTIAFAAIFAAFSLQAPGPAAAADGAQQQPDKNSVIATVNGKPYSLDLFRMFYADRLQMTQAKDSPTARNQALDEFMALVVAAQQAEKMKLDQRDDVKTALKLERLRVLSNAVLQTMAEKEKVSDAELKKAYKAFVANSDRTRYKARHILVKSKDEADKIIKKLGRGADFARLAKDDSIAPNARDGGELGWVDANQIPKPFAEALAGLKPGSYTKEPVRTQFGWHIIELEDVNKAEPPSFEEVEPQIKALVQQQKAMEALVKLKNSAMVEFNQDIVKTKDAEQSK